MSPDPDTPFPRSPDDPDKIRRLRAEAMRNLAEEERAAPAPVYGGPSMGAGGSVTRRWTLRRILMILVGAAGAIIALFFVGRRIVAPVYGGPPIPQPPNDNPPAPVYGGPVPPAPRPGPPPQPAPQSIFNSNRNRIFNRSPSRKQPFMAGLRLLSHQTPQSNPTHSLSHRRRSMAGLHRGLPNRATAGRVNPYEAFALRLCGLGAHVAVQPRLRALRIACRPGAG